MIRCRALMEKGRHGPIWALFPLPDSAEDERSQIRSMETSDASIFTLLDDAHNQTSLSDSAEEECSETVSSGSWEAPNHTVFC